ncbi:hypothetical protein [Deinococcus soli (ex Cha et al. 2016)]|uniref:hypothetical protein n=1 Tax=Deinococcus soli (ex Cha et al. 2016) TaxID=1309411 RepID=UPI001666F701|nr:hypothetical protein [Deinococcus soli (ex Cha et al. 2016)]GGB64520.1 hypothetical protein GCM10008019_20770 [Deinococcus soli (ex Cha et al. 2016)]
MPDLQTPPPRSPLSRQQRLAQREAILLQAERGEITQADARAAIARLDSLPVTRG